MLDLTRRPVRRGRPLVLTGAGLVLALAVCAVALRVTGSAQAEALPGLRQPNAWPPWLLPLDTLVARLAQLAAAGLLIAAVVLLPGEDGALSPQAWLAARWAWVAAAVWALAQLLLIPLTAADLLGIAPWSVSASRMLSTMRDIEVGQTLLLIAALALGAAVAARVSIRRSGAVVALAFSLAAVVPQAAAGHSASSGSHQIAVSSLMIHLAGVVVWAGGLLALILLAPRLSTPMLSDAARRFSGLALPAAVLVLLSGLVEASLSLHFSPAAWLSTDYGVLVSLKLLATVALLAAGAQHRRTSLGRLANGQRRGFVRLAVGECALLGATMGLAVALSRTPPPPRSTPETLAESLLGFPMPAPMTWARIAFDWYPEPLFLLGSLTGIGLYLLGVRRLKRNGIAWPLGRTLPWLAGWVIVIVAMCSGLARYAPVLAWVHMMQHLLLALYAAPLLVLGAPMTLALRAIKPTANPGLPGPREILQSALSSRFSRVITNPFFALTTFAGSMFVIFYSGLYEIMLRSHVGHLAISAHFLFSGYLFYWVIIGIDPGPHRAGAPMRLMMLLISAIAHTVFGVSLMASDVPLGGDWFASLGRTWGPSVVDDTQTAGAVAWTFGELPFMVILAVLLFSWARDDEREQRRRDRAAEIKGSGEADAIEDYNAMLGRLAARDGATPR
jgi:cytochrome c oxidase assembly factor CtaG/putative copper export protein